MSDSSTNRGGRIAQKNALYFTLPSHREPNWRLIKAKEGSVGVDVLLAAHERMCSSSFFILNLTPLLFQILEQEDRIAEEDFTRVIKYCTLELHMFDEVLFQKGMLFSISFLRYFDAAGLFRNRKYKAKEILRCVNHYRPGVNPLTLEDELEIIASSENTLPSASDNLPF